MAHYDGLMENKEFRELTKQSSEAISNCSNLALRSSMTAVGLTVVLVLVDVHPYTAITLPIPSLVIMLGFALGFAIGRINHLYGSFRSFGEVTPAQLQALAKEDKAQVYTIVGLALAGAVSGFFAIFAVSAT